MTENQKPRPWLTWLVVGLVALLCYVLSGGPFMWLDTRYVLHPQLRGAAKAFYRPVQIVIYTGPNPASDVLRWYYDLWKPLDSLAQ